MALIQNIWCYSRALVGYLKVIWYFLKTFCYIKKKNNAKVTCLLHKPACKKITFLNFQKINHPIRAQVKKQNLISARDVYLNFNGNLQNKVTGIV